MGQSWQQQQQLIHAVVVMAILITLLFSLTARRRLKQLCSRWFYMCLRLLLVAWG
jgi:uncharacterized membrane protein YczE